MFYLIKVIKKYIVNMNPVTRRSDSLILVLNVKNATTNDSESWNDDTSELDNWGEDDIYK